MEIEIKEVAENPSVIYWKLFPPTKSKAAVQERSLFIRALIKEKRAVKRLNKIYEFTR